MNIEFRYNKKSSIIRAIHPSEGSIYKKYNRWNKSAVENFIIFDYFKKFISHSIIIEGDSALITYGTEYAAMMLNTNNVEFLNKPSKESYKGLVYRFYCNTGILSNKIKYTTISGVIRSHNVKLIMVFKSSFLPRTKTYFIKREMKEKLYQFINKNININFPVKNISIKKLKYLGIYNKKNNLFNKIKTKMLQLFHLTTKNIF